MRIINQDELKHDPKLINELKKSVFIYPTDTIYGIGCDATNHKLVAKVRAIKHSFSQPFSVIIPNKNMIFEYCEPTEEAREWIKKLPGPFTLIFKMKKKCMAENVNPDIDTIGVRIPDHWFYSVIKKMKVPVVTTSANITGDDFMTSLDNLNSSIKNKVDFIIDDGEIKGKPSTIVNLAKDEIEVKER